MPEGMSDKRLQVLDDRSEERCTPFTEQLRGDMRELVAEVRRLRLERERLIEFASKLPALLSDEKIFAALAAAAAAGKEGGK
jgi:hypothetical protein